MTYLLFVHQSLYSGFHPIDIASVEDVPGNVISGEELKWKAHSLGWMKAEPCFDSRSRGTNYVRPYPQVVTPVFLWSHPHVSFLTSGPSCTQLTRVLTKYPVSPCNASIRPRMTTFFVLLSQTSNKG